MSAKLPGKGIEIHILDAGQRTSIQSVIASAPGAPPHLAPVGGLITCTGEARTIHKGLQRFNPMSVFMHPVPTYSTGNPAEHMTGKIRNANPGQSSHIMLTLWILWKFIIGGIRCSDNACPFKKFARNPTPSVMPVKFRIARPGY